MAQSFTRKINIWINGKQVNAEIASIKNAVRQLTNEQARMTLGSKEYVEHGRKISALKGVISQHNASLNATTSTWQRISTAAKKYSHVAMAAIAAIAGTGLSIRKAVADFNELESSIANLQALTGLAGDDMKWLAEQATVMSTSVDENGVRITKSAKEITDAFTLIGSKRPELLKNKEALVEVTKASLTLAAAGKIDLEQAASAVTGAMNQMNIASAESNRIINVLGAGSQAGAANIEYLNKVVERTGTTAKNLNMPFEQLIGTIEAVAPNFTSAEEASTQLRNVLLLLASGADSTNPKIVGMQTALENLAKEELSVSEMKDRFGTANINMIATLIENRAEVDRYTEAVTGSNTAIEQAAINTSTNAEKLKQAQNELQNIGIAIGQRLSPMLTQGIKGFAGMLKVVKAVVEVLYEYRSVIVVLGSGIVTYTVAVKLATIAEAAHALAIKAKTRAIILATKAQAAFNLVVSTNPILLAVAGIAMLYTALKQHMNHLVRVAQATKTLSVLEKSRIDILDEVQKKTAGEVASLDILFNRIKRLNATSDERKVLISQLNQQYSPYLKNLLDEQATLEQIRAAYENIASALRQKIEIQVKEEKAKELFTTLFELKQKVEEYGPKIQEVSPGLLQHLQNQISQTQEAYDALINEMSDPSSSGIIVVPPGGGGGDASNDKQKWSLANDADFIRQTLKLKEDLHSGVIESEKQYQEMVLALELQFLEARMAKNVETGDDLISLQHQLMDKRLQVHRAEQERLGQIDKETETLVEKEKREYNERLATLGLFNRDWRNMTAQEQAAFEALTQGHKDRLATISQKQLTDEINQRQLAHDTALADMKLRQAQELSEFSGTSTQRSALLKEHQAQERKLSADHLTRMLDDLRSVMNDGNLAGLDLSEIITSEESMNKLQEMINKVKTELAGIMPGTDDAETPGSGLRSVNFDIFGFTPEDWDQLFKNLEDGKLGIDEIQMAVNALGNVWYDVNRMIANAESKRMAEFQKNNDEQKNKLNERLNAGLISQEAYSQAVANLDANLEKQRARHARQQAIRERNVALMQAIVNTAAAVVKALPNIVLAAITGAAGAMQVGIIASTPLPSIPGAETGGFLDIFRQQDGRKFRGRYMPGKRGMVTGPTIITGENGHEYVIPDEGVENPKLRPLINMIEMARVNGSLPTLDPAIHGILSGSVPGRQKGGYLSGTGTADKADTHVTSIEPSNDMLIKVVQDNVLAMHLLLDRLKDPITAEVALTGNKGIYEKDKEYQRARKNAIN